MSNFLQLFPELRKKRSIAEAASSRRFPLHPLVLPSRLRIQGDVADLAKKFEV